MITLVIATRNTHKVQEIRGVLSDTFNFRTLNDFPGLPPVVEDANTFTGNATKKSIHLARWLADTSQLRAEERGSQHRPTIYTLADDSGLEVDALAGAPGVHSARFAALDRGGSGNCRDEDNNAKLLRLLTGVSPAERTARFQCVIALTPVLGHGPQPASPVCYADEAELSTETFEGTCAGRILDAVRGNGGFGYDPLFVPDGFEQTFAELGEAVKNQISHRAKALQKLQRRFQVSRPLVQ